jgi:hypothetical protein
MKTLFSLTRRLPAAILLVILILSVQGLGGFAPARGLQALIDDSAFAGQSPYPTVYIGEAFQVYFSLNNSGTSTWEPVHYWLQNQEGALGANPKQPLSDMVAPGGTSTWNIDMVAPSTPGVYRTSWMVSHDNVDFGAYVYIEVTVLRANAEVKIAGTTVGLYSIPAKMAIRQSFAGVTDGPVQITSPTGTPLVTSQRVAYTPDGGATWPYYSEMMGLPTSKLTTSYVMPWYNNVDLNSQLRFGNVGTGSTTVSVIIGGVLRGAYNVAPSQSVRVSYTGVNAGPVRINSSGGVPIIASERVAYYDGSAWISFSELMGMPVNQLTTSYVVPWYNNVDLNTQLRFGNVGTTNTTVTVRIGGVVRGSYAGVDGGPVRITSSGGVPIIASERVAYYDGSAWTSFSELMALPVNQLTTSYHIPWYNNSSLNTQLRFGNLGTANTIVTVAIGGVARGSYLLAPNTSVRVSYAGVDGGPVQITSSGGVPIIASERVAYYDGIAWSNFSEMMGLPGNQLSTSYVMPWYNNVDLNTQLRIGVP